MATARATEAIPAAHAVPGRQRRSRQEIVAGIEATASRTRVDRCSQNNGDGSGTSLFAATAVFDDAGQHGLHLRRPRAACPAVAHVRSAAQRQGVVHQVGEFGVREMSHCSSFFKLTSA